MLIAIHRVIRVLILEFHKTLIRYICNALRDLLPFVQFEKQEKHPWRNVTFSN